MIRKIEESAKGFSILAISREMRVQNLLVFDLFRRYFLAALVCIVILITEESFSKPNRSNVVKAQFNSHSGYTSVAQSYSLSLQWEQEKISLRTKWGETNCSSGFAIDTSEKHRIEKSIQKLKFCRRKSKYASIAQDAPTHTITLFHLSGKKFVYRRKKFLEGTFPYLCSGQENLYHTFHSILGKRKGKICGGYDILLQ